MRRANVRPATWRAVSRYGLLMPFLGVVGALLLGMAAPVALAAVVFLCVVVCLLLVALDRSAANAIASAVRDRDTQERLVVVDHGYYPATIAVEVGSPVRLVFDRRGRGECSAWVVFPALGLARQLVPHATTAVEFVPEHVGSFSFSCKYGVCRGTVLVRRAAETIRAAQCEPLQARERQAGLATGRGRPLALVRPLAWGVLGATGLLVLYVVIVGGASRSLEHVVSLLATDWPFVAAIATGFGVQVGLYSHLRSLTQVPAAANAATGVGTGTSTVAMIACCAHHATDILPVLGLSAVAGAAGFLAQWRVPLMSLGIAMNLVGIALTLRLVRRVQGHLAAASPERACH